MITVEDLSQILSTAQVCDRLGRIRYPEEWEKGKEKPLGKEAVFKYLNKKGSKRLPNYLHPTLGYLILESDLEWFIENVFKHISPKGGKPKGFKQGDRED